DGVTVGAEALLRWRHPDRGLIAPNGFIGLAEETGLMVPIGYWVMEQVCQDVATWPVGMRASINLSANQLADTDLVARTVAILESVILLTNSLGMEALGEGVETEEQADHLRTMGCDYAQGFWFGEPRPVEDFTARVAAEACR